jgi:hypothetical protein
MSLLAPLMLLGLLGLLLPLLGHLRGKEEPRVVRFAGLRFLAAGDEVVTQRRRLRDVLLLLVRLGLLLLLVLALTRPVSTGDARVAVLGEPHDAVLLLDASFSMNLRIDGETSLRVASEDAAAAILEALPPGSRVGLVSTDPNGPRRELSADPDRVRAAISEWVAAPPRGGAWTLESGLPRAVALLRQAGDGHPRKVVYAIGDFTPRGLASLPATAAADIPVLPVAALGSLDAPPPVPEHMSLESATWVPAREIDPRAVRISGELRRHGGEGERVVPVRLRVDGEVTARVEVVVPADGRAGFEFTHTSASAGPTPAVVELEAEADPLPGDEARHLWLAGEDGVEVALVNGDPSEMRAHDEVYFLATALASSASARRLRIHSLAPDQLEARLRSGDKLADIDVLVLANLRAPADDIAPALIDRVAAGMGLWISVGDRVEARAYNDRLGVLLPLLLREPLIVGTAPGRSEARTEGVAPPEPHPPDLPRPARRARPARHPHPPRLPARARPDPRRRGRPRLHQRRPGPALAPVRARPRRPAHHLDRPRLVRPAPSTRFRPARRARARLARHPPPRRRRRPARRRRAAADRQRRDPSPSTPPTAASSCSRPSAPARPCCATPTSPATTASPAAPATRPSPSPSSRTPPRATPPASPRARPGSTATRSSPPRSTRAGARWSSWPRCCCSPRPCCARAPGRR